jgi:translation initiation factor 1
LATTQRSGLVYSTDVGRMCPQCRQPLSLCLCKAIAAAKNTPTDGTVKVSRETKGRGGKTATVIKGVALDATKLTVLAKRLKAACGSGGTVKDGVIEVQGDHCDRVMALLAKEGFVVKRAGG